MKLYNINNNESFEFEAQANSLRGWSVDAASQTG